MDRKKLQRQRGRRGDSATRPIEIGNQSSISKGIQKGPSIEQEEIKPLMYVETETERDREGEKERERDRETERETERDRNIYM